LNELDEEDWKKMTDEFLPKMTDELIEKSLASATNRNTGVARNEEIIQKLKDRRKYFAGEMMRVLSLSVKDSECDRQR
jgi:hypothetical protein